MSWNTMQSQKKPLTFSINSYKQITAETNLGGKARKQRKRTLQCGKVCKSGRGSLCTLGLHVRKSNSGRLQGVGGPNPLTSSISELLDFFFLNRFF